MYPYVCIYIYTYMNLYSLTCTHTYTHWRFHTCARMYAHIHIPYVCTYIFTACTFIRIHGDAHVRMYVRTYIYIPASALGRSIGRSEAQAARESSYCFCACDIFGCVTDLYVWSYMCICVRVTTFCLWNLSHIRIRSWVVALQVCHTYKCVTHININVRMSQVTHTNESCFVYGWVMSHHSVGHSVPDPYA